MLLKINIPSNDIILPAKEAGPVLAALENAKAIRSEGYGKDQKWVECPADEKISVAFIPDTFLNPAPEPMKKAIEDYEEANKRWLNEWNKRNAAEAKVKELEEKLKAVGVAVTASQAKSEPQF